MRKACHCRKLELQSAMEYLMTYGWAILIIAVVLGALYYLGVFNSATLGPRAQPGSCKVIRPLGPGTTSYINLAGVCTGQLPQFVGSLNGAISYVNVGSSTSLFPNIFTVTAWVKLPQVRSTAPVFSFTNSIAYTPTLSLTWSSSANSLIYLSANNYRYFQNAPVNILDGNWHFIAFVVPGNAQSDISNSVMYADGVSQTIYTTYNIGLQDIKTGPVYIGKAGGYYFSGLIANIQIYNTSLDASAIQSLYAEGIGGAPQVLQNLVGWWPLNGNVNDYSGNNNNGALFTSTWTR